MIIMESAFHIQSMKRRNQKTTDEHVKEVKDIIALAFLKGKATKPKEETAESILDKMREGVDKKQEKMRPENYENVKLVPVLDAAYDLYMKLEGLKEKAEKQCRKIVKEKERLKLERDRALNADTFVSGDDDSRGNKERYLFKTIMCPLLDRCPKLKKHRWPNSLIKTVSKIGANCPYAHAMNELRFPEEYASKIACAKNQIKSI